MNDHLFPDKQAQRMSYARIIALTLGGALGASTVLWIKGKCPFSVDFLLRYALIMIGAVLIKVGSLSVRVQLWRINAARKRCAS
jgi:vacuolar-type H+-ATPase subunit I/STV1